MTIVTDQVVNRSCDRTSEMLKGSSEQFFLSCCCCCCCCCCCWCCCRGCGCFNLCRCRTGYILLQPLMFSDISIWHFLSSWLPSQPPRNRTGTHEPCANFPVVSQVFFHGRHKTSHGRPLGTSSWTRSRQPRFTPMGFPTTLFADNACPLAVDTELLFLNPEAVFFDIQATWGLGLVFSVAR